MTLQIIASQKGNKLLIQNRYAFNFKKQCKNYFTWRCSYYFVNKCPSTCKTTTDDTSGIFCTNLFW